MQQFHTIAKTHHDVVVPLPAFVVCPRNAMNAAQGAAITGGAMSALILDGDGHDCIQAGCLGDCETHL